MSIYVGPKAPDGLEANWIPTSGKRPLPAVRFYGPTVFLSPRQALPYPSCFMTGDKHLHGSLSNDVGRVSVKWLVEDVDDVPTLIIVWSESGGPTVIKPTRRGFGSRLIRMGIAGTGHVEKRYPPDDFIATFKAPMSTVRDISS